MLFILNVIVFVDSVVFIVFSEFIMSLIIMFLVTVREIFLPSSGKVWQNFNFRPKERVDQAIVLCYQIET